MNSVDYITSSFRQEFGLHPVLVVRAPGRINLIGEHIDYHHGLVLPAAIDKAIYFALSPSQRVRIRSLDHNEWYDPAQGLVPAWAGYLEKIHAVAAREQLPVLPMVGTIAATLPVGSGLSSSAALCCGYIYALNHFCKWDLDRMEMASFAQAVEHELGVMCGLMDQFAVLHGRQSHAMLFDCLDQTFQYIKLGLADVDFFLLHTGVSHSLADSAYNERRRDSETALRKIHAQFSMVSTYRDVSVEQLNRTHTLTQTELRLGAHVVNEIERVRQAMSAIDSDDPAKLGALMYETHWSLSEYYEVSCSESDFLVKQASQMPHVMGARQMGGGFGGCILFLVKNVAAAEVINRLQTAYLEEFGLDARLISVEISEGVGVIKP